MTTFVAGLTPSGLVEPFVIDGAINGDAFAADAERVLVPELSPKAVVVIDNLGSHRSARVRPLIVSSCTELRFLSPCNQTSNPSKCVRQAEGAPAQGRRANR